MSGNFNSSYFGDMRTVPFDIGADEYGSGVVDTPPNAPQGLSAR
jgi:hypothetical protein